QIRHRSSSATLPHTAQKRTLSLTSVSTDASRRTSAGSAWRMWKAMRWALLGPTPGSRPSSSIRSWTIPSYTPATAWPVVVRAVLGTAVDAAVAAAVAGRGDAEAGRPGRLGVAAPTAEERAQVAAAEGVAE